MGIRKDNILYERSAPMFASDSFSSTTSSFGHLPDNGNIASNTLHRPHVDLVTTAVTSHAGVERMEIENSNRDFPDDGNVQEFLKEFFMNNTNSDEVADEYNVRRQHLDFDLDSRDSLKSDTNHASDNNAFAALETTEGRSGTNTDSSDSFSMEDDQVTSDRHSLDQEAVARSRNEYDAEQMTKLEDNESLRSTDQSDDEDYIEYDGENGYDGHKRSHFLRGIINPNYPGFQHLIQSSSEYFFGDAMSDYYDSDISEYDMETSARSHFDDNSKETHSSLTNNNGDARESEVENNNFLNHGSTESSEDVEKPSSNDLSRNLQSSLHLADDVQVAAIDVEESGRRSEFDCEAEAGRCGGGEMHVACSTPDILVKNYHSCKENHLKGSNGPDLLQNVYPKTQPPAERSTTLNHNTDTDEPRAVAIYREYQKMDDGQDGVDEHMEQQQQDEEANDDVTAKTIPDDIIGNFKEEVQRDFELLVSGCRREFVGFSDEKMTDAVLSNGRETINSNKSKFNHSNEKEEGEALEKNETRITSKNATSSSLGDTVEDADINNVDATIRTRYKKHSYDERQLPPVGIDYKCGQLSKMKGVARKAAQCVDKPSKRTMTNKCSTEISKTPTAAQRLLQNKRKANTFATTRKDHNHAKEVDDFQQYQKLTSIDKEMILSKSRYSRVSLWAIHLKKSMEERGTKKLSDLQQPRLSLTTTSASSSDPMETTTTPTTMAKHLEITKHFERKRQSDREEIRRRLAMGVESDYFRKLIKGNGNGRENAFLHHNGNGLPFFLMNELSSDNESHSSDSETCPKLSRITARKNTILSNILIGKHTTIPLQVLSSSSSREDNECDFFTKQARMQIEARMALAQAKDMAHIQIEIDKQKLRSSPITGIIRDSLQKVGVQISSAKRRLSRQMLTDMNIAQLQILVNELHTHIEDLNESLVHYLMVRDELHLGQDALFGDIEDLSRYLGIKEQLLKQQNAAATTLATTAIATINTSP